MDFDDDQEEEVATRTRVRCSPAAIVHLVALVTAVRGPRCSICDDKLVLSACCRSRVAMWKCYVANIRTRCPTAGILGCADAASTKVETVRRRLSAFVFLLLLSISHVGYLTYNEGRFCPA